MYFCAMLFEDNYYTIAEPCEGLYKDKGSKFIGYAFGVKSEEDVKRHLAMLRKEHHSARHHCYAYRLGADKQTYRANDDGEPSSTAGKPILGQIQSKDLTDVLVVVVRYFGGTLLGVSGLITAYKQAAADTLGNARIIEKFVTEQYCVGFEYLLMNDVMKVIKDEELKIVSQEYATDCLLTFEVRRSHAQRAVEMFKKMHGVIITELIK